MRTILIALAALLLATTAGASALACQDATPTQTLDTPAGTYYLVVGDCGPTSDCLFSAWVVEESNGVPGLQVDDEGRYEPACDAAA